MTSDQIAMAALVVTGIGVVWAVGWNLYTRAADAKATLSIGHDDGNNIVNTVIRFDEFTTAFLLDLIVANESPNRTITVQDYWLEIPWRDETLQPLLDPAEIDGGQIYRFGASHLEYPREMVINHRRLSQGKIGPGEAISGLFMVQGNAPVPFGFGKNEFIPVTVAIRDTNGKVHRSKDTFVWPTPPYPGIERSLPPNPLYRIPKPADED
jgi:hypothetical protein